MLGPIEPNADMRQQAVVAFQLYQSYLTAGFSDAQAMQLTCVILAEAANPNRGIK